MQSLYSILFTLLSPFILLRLLWRSRRSPDYRKRMGERFGFSLSPAVRHLLGQRQQGQPLLWVHAVSVGESVAARPLLVSLLQQYPDLLIVATTMTPTGAARIANDFGDQPRLAHGYLPYDVSWALGLFFRRVKPSLLVLMETELWPNLISCCARDRVPVILANARLSERSARSYARAKKLSQRMLGALSHIAAQSEADASRFIDLGADPARISVTGSLKFYVAKTESVSKADEQLASIDVAGRWVILAASTREGEEEKILTAYRLVTNAIDECLLLLVPRHPERFAAVAKLCQTQGFRLCRRSSGEPLRPEHEVFLGDSMGEMGRYISLANVAFVGGSLVDTGCQSVLEPAAAGRAVITGPSQFNFAAICQALEEAEGMLTVANEQELAQALIGLHADQDRLRSMGLAAADFVARNREALPKLQALIAEQLRAAS